MIWTITQRFWNIFNLVFTSLKSRKNMWQISVANFIFLVLGAVNGWCQLGRCPGLVDYQEFSTFFLKRKEILSKGKGRVKFCPFVRLSVCHHFNISNIRPSIHYVTHILYIIGKRRTSAMTMKMTHTKTNTKTKTKCLETPLYAIFSKCREFKDIK